MEDNKCPSPSVQCHPSPSFFNVNPVQALCFTILGISTQKPSAHGTTF